MVSLSAITRISDQLQALEARHAKPWRSAVVTMEAVDNESAVLQRHFQQHPEQRNPDVLFLTIYDMPT